MLHGIVLARHEGHTLRHEFGTASSAYGDVKEYRAGQGQPYQTITKMNAPADVIVNKTGYVYVSESSTPAVVVFKPGSTEPWHEFRLGMNSPAGIAYYVGGASALRRRATAVKFYCRFASSSSSWCFMRANAASYGTRVARSTPAAFKRSYE